MTDIPRQSPYLDAALAVPPHPHWTKPERWAWARIARGLIADMACYPGEESDEAAADWWLGLEYEKADAPDPQKQETFKDQHTLSERFLRTVIFHEPYASAPERPGVRVWHAVIKEMINWSGRETKGELWLDGCRFEADLTLHGLRVAGTLSMRRSAVLGSFDADRMKLAGNLAFSGGFSAKGDVRLSGAEIVGQASFGGATLHGELQANEITLKGALFCDEGFSVQGDISLLDAEIGGMAGFQGATIKGGLRADRMKLAGGLFCYYDFSALGDVRLLGANIGVVVTFEGATLHGALRADGMKLTGGLLLRGLKRLGESALLDVEIGRNLQFARSEIDGVIDLTGSQVAGSIELAQVPGTEPTWKQGAKLILRNVTAGALAGGIDAFRATAKEDFAKGKKQPFVPMDLSGLRYSRLGGFKALPGGTLADAHWRDLVAWLEAGIADDNGNAHASFTPGPFRTLARELADSGHVGKARRILHAMNFHERKCAKGFDQFGLHIAGMLTGFGLRNFYAGLWFLGLVALAAGYGLWASGTHFSPSPAGFAHAARWAWFSLGNAVPLITLDDAHKTFLAVKFGTKEEAVPIGPASVFYAAKLMGFAILTYLAASVSGMANRDKG